MPATQITVPHQPGDTVWILYRCAILPIKVSAITMNWTKDLYGRPGKPHFNYHFDDSAMKNAGIGLSRDEHFIERGQVAATKEELLQMLVDNLPGLK